MSPPKLDREILKVTLNVYEEDYLKIQMIALFKRVSAAELIRQVLCDYAESKEVVLSVSDKNDSKVHIDVAAEEKHRKRLGTNRKEGRAYSPRAYIKGRKVA